MVDVRGDVLRPPHDTAPAAVKSNKSAGLVGAKNEMLKNSKTYLLPCIVKLFNLILSKLENSLHHAII